MESATVAVLDEVMRCLDVQPVAVMSLACISALATTHLEALVAAMALYPVFLPSQKPRQLTKHEAHPPILLSLPSLP